jgi:hypothetical protein
MIYNTELQTNNTDLQNIPKADKIRIRRLSNSEKKHLYSQTLSVPPY